MGRKSALSVSGGIGGAVKAGDILSQEHRLQGFPMLYGRWLEVAFAANTAITTANHGLGRDYIGWLSPLLGASVAFSNAEGLMLLTPAYAREGGYDPAKVAVFTRTNAGGTAGAIDLTVWVF